MLGRIHLLSAPTYQALVDIIVFLFLFNKEHQHFCQNEGKTKRMVGPVAGMQTLTLRALGPHPFWAPGQQDQEADLGVPGCPVLIPPPLSQVRPCRLLHKMVELVSLCWLGEEAEAKSAQPLTWVLSSSPHVPRD